MRACIKTQKDGWIELQLDEEAARTVFASILFASRFHDGIAPLVKVATEVLGTEERCATRREALPCQ